MNRRSADEQAARAARVQAIRACRCCDPSGWRLGADLTPVDPAVRCDHRAATTTPPARDITEPIHEQNNS